MLDVEKLDMLYARKVNNINLKKSTVVRGIANSVLAN